MKDLVGVCCAAGLALSVLSGCTSGGTTGLSGGVIEIAATSTCLADSSTDCVEVNGKHVLVTDGAFQDVDVKAVTAADGQPGNAVTLELTQDGVAVLTATTTEASEAGSDARLVIKVGGEVVSAMNVAEPLRDDHVTIALPADVDAEEFAEEIRQS